MAGNAPTTITATISVSKRALDLELLERRHTLLVFKFAGGTETIVVYAAGSSKNYRAESIDDYDPARSRNAVGRNELGTP